VRLELPARALEREAELDLDECAPACHFGAANLADTPERLADVRHVDRLKRLCQGRIC
jgi:hypothetical protein